MVYSRRNSWKEEKKIAGKKPSSLPQPKSISKIRENLNVSKSSQAASQIIAPHQELAITSTSSIVSALTSSDSASSENTSDTCVIKPRSVVDSIFSTSSAMHAVTTANVEAYLLNNYEGTYQFFDWYEGTFPPLPDNYSVVPASRVGRCVVYQKSLFDVLDRPEYMLAWVYSESQWLLEKLSGADFDYCCEKGVIRISGGQQDSSSLSKSRTSGDNQVKFA